MGRDVPPSQKQWDLWVKQNKLDLTSQFSEACKVAGLGLDDKVEPREIYIVRSSNSKDSPWMLSKFPEKEDSITLKVDFEKQSATLKKSQIQNLDSTIEDWYGQKFIRFTPSKISEVSDPIYLSGFIRPDHSSYWFLYDLNRTNIEKFQKFNVFKYNPLMIFKGQIKSNSSSKIDLINFLL